MVTQKVTVSLSDDILRYADSYKESRGLNRSEVFTLALKLLREKELSKGYRAMAEDQAARGGPWLDSGFDEILGSLNTTHQ